MRLAVIADIHGNLTALNKVIDDAESRNVDGYIFAGDYAISCPYPNECITRIRSLDTAYVIRGNEEKYLENLIDRDQSAWTDGQMQISYWAYRQISRDNLQFILSCPERLDTKLCGNNIHIAHSSAEFIADGEHRNWRTSLVAKRYEGITVDSDRFKNDIQSYFEHDKDFKNIVHNMDRGVYIFGHTHLQWWYQSEDGRVLFINPGSCGLPLDCIENSIPYSILEISENEAPQIEEIRIPFSSDAYKNEFAESGISHDAAVWSKLALKQLLTAREQVFFFLHYVKDYAEKIGDTERPYSVKTWEKAYELWTEENE